MVSRLNYWGFPMSIGDEWDCFEDHSLVNDLSGEN
jgi:hypothetical protein